MLANFLAVIGPSWSLNQKRSSDISCLQCLWEREREENKKQSRVKEVNTLQWQQWNHRVASPQSDFCESAQYLRSNSRFMRRSAQAHQGPEKPASPQHLEKVEIPTVLSEAEKFYQWTAVEKPTARIRPKIRAIVRRPEVMGLKLVEREQYFHTLETEEGQQMQHLCRECTLPRNDEGTRVRGWIRSKTRIGSVLNIKVC